MKTGRERERASEGEEEGAKRKCNSIVGDVMGYLDSLLDCHTEQQHVLYCILLYDFESLCLSCLVLTTALFHIIGSKFALVSQAVPIHAGTNVGITPQHTSAFLAIL